MKTVTVVRIYVREQEHLLEKLVKFLQDDSDIAGVTVFRGIEGFAGPGPAHQAFLLDLSLDLPLVVEFYDEPGRADETIHTLLRHFPLQHVISWTANSHTA